MDALRFSCANDRPVRSLQMMIAWQVTTAVSATVASIVTILQTERSADGGGDNYFAPDSVRTADP